MNVDLPYGDANITITVPDTATVLTPAASTPVADPDAAVLHAILNPIDAPPLAKLVRPGQKACVVVSDVTRPVPNEIILPPVLDTLERNGVRRDDIVILVGTGLHRPSRDDERRRFLGDAILERYRVVDHDARDEAQLAPPAGPHNARFNRYYVDADLRILTGFVEPHLFAGYSGGGKAVLPAIASAADIMANHDARMIGHPKSTWCTTHGNPIFEAMRDAAVATQPSFTINVTLDERKCITGVFAGDLVAAHDAAIAQAARQALRPIPHLYDVVVATNMGYPADLNLYQSVKAMSVAAQACEPGGAILLVAECREGLGGDEYVQLMRSAASPQALLQRFESSDHRTVHDQWQAQVQAMVQARCDVHLHSSLDPATVESAFLHPAPDLNATFAKLLAHKRADLAREPTVCVLPFGQLTVPRPTIAPS
jgi:nickel-dependent lactate racemase